jgi:hypothetical protein
VRGSCPAVTLDEKSLKGVPVVAEDVNGVKMVVAEEAVVAVVAGVEALIGPGVHTSCSNDRFELKTTFQQQSVRSGGHRTEL